MEPLRKIYPFDFESDEDVFLAKLNAAIDRINELEEVIKIQGDQFAWLLKKHDALEAKYEGHTHTSKQYDEKTGLSYHPFTSTPAHQDNQDGE